MDIKEYRRKYYKEHREMWIAMKKKQKEEGYKRPKKSGLFVVSGELIRSVNINEYIHSSRRRGKDSKLEKTIILIPYSLTGVLPDLLALYQCWTDGMYRRLDYASVKRVLPMLEKTDSDAVNDWLLKYRDICMRQADPELQVPNAEA